MIEFSILGKLHIGLGMVSDNFMLFFTPSKTKILDVSNAGAVNNYKGWLFARFDINKADKLIRERIKTFKQI